MKPSAVTVIFLLVLSTKAFSQSEGKTFADSLLDAGLYKEASEEYTKLLKKDPANDTLFWFRALSYLNLEEYDKSAADFKKILKSEPNCLRCEYYLTRILYAKGETINAVKKADSCLKAQRDSALISMAYADMMALKTTLHLQLGEKEKGRETMNAMVDIYPDSSWAYYMRADFNLGEGAKTAAFKDIEKAITLDSTVGRYYRIKAELYKGINYSAEALELAEKAIRLDSADPASHNLKGELLYRANKYTEALASITKAISLDSLNWQNYVWQNMIYHALEDMDGQCSCAEKALPIFEKDSLNPDSKEYGEQFKEIRATLCNINSPGYYYQRGIAMYNLGLYDSAVGYYTKGLKKFPDHPIMHNFRGNAYIELKEWEKAEKDYLASLKSEEFLIKYITEEAKGFDKNTYALGLLSTAYYGIAQAAMYQGKTNRALEAIDSALQLATGINQIPKEDYYNQKGLIYMAVADYDKAFETFEKVKILSPRDPKGYLNMALALANKAGGKKDKYMQLGIKATSNNPGGMNFDFESNPIKLTDVSRPLMNEALRYCNQAVELNADDNGGSLLVRGFIKHLAGNPSACQDVRSAMEKGNEEAPAYYAKICK